MIRLAILVLIQAGCVVGAQCFLKVALARMGDFAWAWSFFKSALTTWQLYISGVLAITGVVEWMVVLKHYDFSLAYPLTAISFIVSLVAGALIFHEAIPPTRWIGAVLIMIGVYFIAK